MDRHSISNKKEFEAICGYLKDALGFAKEYGRNFNARVYYSVSHEWPAIAFHVSRDFDKQKKHFIRKDIFLSISDYNYPPIYKLWITISNDYGYKEILEFIHSLFKENYLFKRDYLKKDIGYLEAPIDKEKLKNLLDEARRAL